MRRDIDVGLLRAFVAVVETAIIMRTDWDKVDLPSLPLFGGK